jgi:hypothetical protein
MWYGHFLHFAVVWSIFPILVHCAKENLATLAEIRREWWQIIFTSSVSAWTRVNPLLHGSIRR